MLISFSNLQLSFISETIQSDDDLSDSDEKQTLVELVIRFRGMLKIEAEESTECVVPNLRNSSWALLKVIYKKLKDDPRLITEAAQLNLHSSVLEFIVKLLPTVDHQVRSTYIYSCSFYMLSWMRSTSILILTFDMVVRTQNCTDDAHLVKRLTSPLLCIFTQAIICIFRIAEGYRSCRYDKLYFAEAHRNQSTHKQTRTTGHFLEHASRSD